MTSQIISNISMWSWNTTTQHATTIINQSTSMKELMIAILFFAIVLLLTGAIALICYLVFENRKRIIQKIEKEIEFVEEKIKGEVDKIKLSNLLEEHQRLTDELKKKIKSRV